VGVLYVEVNQGGDLWKDVFKNVPAKYRSKNQSLSKQIRAGKALNFYQQGKVRHTAHFPVLEEQMYSFPKLSHEDVLDSVVSGVLYFLDNKAVKLETRQINYLRRQHV
jgi:phage terminase large subunit-like protein